RRRSRASPSVDLAPGGLALAGASGLAPPAPPHSPAVTSGRAAHPPVARGPSRRLGHGLGLQELERLDVEQAGWIADDVGVPQRLQELLGTVEVPHPDADRSQSLRYVRVGPGAGWDPVLGREPGRFV